MPFIYRTFFRFLTLSFMFFAPAITQAQTQFVSMAFDGSKSLNMWQETLDFALEHNVHFTYFISGTMFLTDDAARFYQGPRHNKGRSDIGFGGTRDEVAVRVAFVRRAYREGHEIASHANGHWKGENWSVDEWLNEMGQFQAIMANTHELNGIENTNAREWSKIVGSIHGLRAPLLSANDNMLIALQQLGYSYDTSSTNTRDYIPVARTGGIWNFPLASLPLGRGSVLSMDYNFKVLHDKTDGDPYSSMMRAYMAYFEHNYQGTRAPIDIGHHFSRWNRGAYWRAMKQFTINVCNLPDVHCGTYTDLQDYMEQLETQRR